MRQKRITRVVHGVEGEGPTVQAAKENAITRIQHAFSGEENYQPEILRHRGITAMMFRTLDGWGYSFIEYPDRDVTDGKVWANSGNNQTYHECQRTMRRHVASCSWMPEDGTEVPDFVDVADRADLARDHAWQLSIIEARDVHGVEDTEAQRFYADLKNNRGGFQANYLAAEVVEHVKRLAGFEERVRAA